MSVLLNGPGGSLWKRHLGGGLFLLKWLPLSLNFKGEGPLWYEHAGVVAEEGEEGVLRILLHII